MVILRSFVVSRLCRATSNYNDDKNNNNSVLCHPMINSFFALNVSVKESVTRILTSFLWIPRSQTKTIDRCTNPKTQNSSNKVGVQRRKRA